MLWQQPDITTPGAPLLGETTALNRARQQADRRCTPISTIRYYATDGKLAAISLCAGRDLEDRDHDRPIRARGRGCRAVCRRPHRKDRLSERGAEAEGVPAESACRPEQRPPRGGGQHPRFRCAIPWHPEAQDE